MVARMIAIKVFHVLFLIKHVLTDDQLDFSEFLECSDIELLPNEWGSYYRLPANLQEMENIFSIVKQKELNSMECANGPGQLINWYNSSKNSSIFILTYECPSLTESFYRFYCLVDESGKLLWGILGTLSDFDIDDVNEYQEEKPNYIFMSELLHSVEDQIALQVVNGGNESVCRHPGMKSNGSFERKRENVLQYYRFGY